MTNDRQRSTEPRYLAPKTSSTLSQTRFSTRRTNPTMVVRWLRSNRPLTTTTCSNPTLRITVADWWGNLDCRVMRIALVRTTTTSTLQWPTRNPNTSLGRRSAEASIYCGTYPGSGNMPVIRRKRWDQVQPLQATKSVSPSSDGLSAVARRSTTKSFNGRTVDVDDRSLSGLAQVGALLTARPTGINDAIRDVMTMACSATSGCATTVTTAIERATGSTPYTRRKPDDARQDDQGSRCVSMTTRGNRDE